MAATDTARTLVPDGSRERGVAVPVRPALPVMLVTAGSVIGLASAQGGYFPTSWGLGAALLLWTNGLWLVVSGRTDAGRIDVLFLSLLGALTCWIGLSIAWSVVPAQSVLELERTIVPLAGVTAVLVLARREHVQRLFCLLLGSIATVSTYSLATRLFPDRLGSFDAIAGYRLSDPLGYWNTLGVFAAMGILLAVGVVADAKSRWARAAASAALVVLTVTLYFTYSRGAWLALALGFGVLVAATPRRLWTLLSAVAAGVPAAIAVLVASRSYPLTHQGVAIGRTAADGHRLAEVILVLAAFGVGLALVLELAQRQVALPRGVRRAIGGALLVFAVVVCLAVLVREGGPVTATRHTWHAFSADPPATGPSLNDRLFNFSGSWRVNLWRAARDLYVEHPETGSGAGTFERYWQTRDEAAVKVRDAHSLYLETLAELGPVGLALLVALLLVPEGAAVAVRRHAMLPAALAAYAAFLIHAGVDWDWELSGVTLTALLVGSLAVISLRNRSLRVIGGNVRVVACAAVLLASMAMILAYLGNGALDRAQTAVTEKSYTDAVDEANRARRLMPWSPWPLIARGDAQLAAGDAIGAAASYRHAVSVDSGEWRAWLGLAIATRGAARAAALAHARRLYPKSAEIAETVATLKVKTKE
jgi:O-antigen ligase